jgi:hypothetical protein
MKCNRSQRLAAATVGLLALAAALAFVGGSAAVAPDDKKPAPEKRFSAEGLAFFEKDVLPILQANCLECHGAKKPKGGLRLTSRERLLKGGDLGPALDEAKPEESRLLLAIIYKDKPQMPPSGKLPQKDIDTLTRWVKMGAPWTPGGTETIVKADPEGGKVTPESRNYWCYRPLKRPEPPAVKDNDWVKSPIDAFILARLEAKGLTPNPPADRVALIRRATYDLTGLPPTPEEVDAFVKDKSPDAYEKLLDRLLASPQYGEKWGRHWLDLVRYAETHGYERDSPKPFAWRYRDYVIDSFNQDKAYNVFLCEQLAGDELDKVTPETLIATGYYRLGIWDDEPADPALARYDVLDGVVSTTAQVVLGMTVGCARCHDHKRDPIPQKDYYRLLAFFRDVTDMNVKNTRKVLGPADRREAERVAREREQREAELRQKIYELEQQFTLALAEKKGIQTGRPSSPDLVDLSYRFYRDTWEKLPDFDALKHETAGRAADGYFSLAPASRQEAIGMVFEGKLKVPEKGDYVFHIRSSEGVRLIVDGKAVFDKPGRGRHSGEAKAALAAGLLPVRLEYFNSYEKPELSVSWSGPGFDRRSLSAEGERVLAADSREQGQTWSYTFAKPGDDWFKPGFKDSEWSNGPGGFGTRGTPGAVVRTKWNSQDVWLRRSFRLEEVPSLLALDLHHDDEVEVYLNGTRVYAADGFLVKYVRVPLGPEAAKALRKGDNLLAVHCHQTTGGQYIDVGLVQGGAADLGELFRKYGGEVLGAEPTRRYFALTARLDESRKAPPPEVGLEVMCVEERGRAETTVLIRGNPGSPGDKVEPGFPEVLVESPKKIVQRDPSAPTSGKRRALAEWLTDEGNPLTARVMANRLWLYHFGRGIVPTANDFGKLGEQPTHPELLDWLATEFMRGGWKIKRMHKLIMTSNAYLMSAKADEKGLKLDPANMLFWRFNMRRLAAEEVRDSILSVSGKLNLKAGGPSVYPPIPREVLAGQSMPGQGWGKSTPEEASRRSVYVHVKRSLLVPILSVHDEADTDSSCPVRYTTIVPTQALGMLNGQFTNEQAGALAERLQREAPDDLAAQVRRAIRLTTARAPAEEEVKKDVAFIKEMQTKEKLRAFEALKQYCLLALNANEFIYLD